jgi:DDE superfamily endonuclease
VSAQFRGAPGKHTGLPLPYTQSKTDLGIKNDYVCKELLIPHKKPKKQELTQEQKADNKLLVRERIVVEHSIAGLKRYRILSDHLRMHDLKLYNVILGVWAGLWNFSLSC